VLYLVGRQVFCSTRLEEEDGDLSKVEVDEVFGLVGNVGTEVAAHNAVPGGVVLFVEFLLDEGGDVLLDVELLESLSRDVNSILLHVFGHISVLNYSFAVGHLVSENNYNQRVKRAFKPRPLSYM